MTEAISVIAWSPPDFTVYQWIMIVCSLAVVCVIFTLLRFVPKTPKTRQIQLVMVVSVFVMIAATICERFGLIR
jgi:uncharacterized BrkB/YihY/UPF0761 family membrane protein